MNITIRGAVTHRCPFVDEVDVGEVELSYHLDVEPLELHQVRALLESFHDRKITHEALTAELGAALPGVDVTTRWRTAGLEVTCTA